MAQKSQAMGFLGGKRGATTAPSVEKPTATTASSAHCSKTGMLRYASRLRTNNSNPSAVSTKETAHIYQASHPASLWLSKVASWRKVGDRSTLNE
jgi:hypothetical protein